jgi:hypothetical protein
VKTSASDICVGHQEHIATNGTVVEESSFDSIGNLAFSAQQRLQAVSIVKDDNAKDPGLSLRLLAVQVPDRANTMYKSYLRLSHAHIYDSMNHK